MQGCLSCADRELFKNFTRQEVKEKILRKLGMIAPPNVTTEAVPEHLLNRLLNRWDTFSPQMTFLICTVTYGWDVVRKCCETPHMWPDANARAFHATFPNDI